MINLHNNSMLFFLFSNIYCVKVTVATPITMNVIPEEKDEGKSNGRLLSNLKTN